MKNISLITKIWKSGNRFLIPLDNDTIHKIQDFALKNGKILGKDEIYIKVKIEVIK